MIEEEARIAEILIKEFKERYLFPPSKTWPKAEFYKRSYERWAADEILKRIKERPNVGPINVIQGFMEELDYFMDLTDHWASYRIFIVAREISEDILKLFL